MQRSIVCMCRCNELIKKKKKKKKKKKQISLFKGLQNLLAEFAQENIVVAGDFNCALRGMEKGGNSIFKKSSRYSGDRASYQPV